MTTREEQAKAEIGHTTIGRGTAMFLVGVFIAIIVIVPLVQHAHDIRMYRAGERVEALPYCYTIFGRLREAVQIGSMHEGNLWQKVLKADREMLREMAAYEATMDEDSWLAATLIPPVQSVMTRFLGVGNESTYLGRNGWLFYRADVDYLMGPGFLDEFILQQRARGGNEWEAAPQPDPLPAILQFRDDLARRGIHLVLLPTPLKTVVHGDSIARAGDDSPSVLNNRSYVDFIAEMQEAGIDVLDVTELLVSARERTSEAQYLKTDTHWTPGAMEIVAAALAEHVQPHIAIEEAIEAEYTRGQATVTKLGDIAGMLRLPEGQKMFVAETVCLKPVMDAAGKPWRKNRAAPVLVLGDSFSNIYALDALEWGTHAGLVEQLSYFLGLPCDRIVENDNGSYVTRQKLAEGLAIDSHRLDGKQVVVWQFAMRELAQGDWRVLPLGE